MINERALFWTVLVVDVLLCVFIIVINLTLMLVILSCRQTRSRVRNVMLVSMCAADLVVGAFTQPLYMNTYITRSMYHSCELHVLVQLVGDYTQDFVCFWTLVTVAAVYVWRLVGDRWGWRATLPGQYDVLQSGPRSGFSCLPPHVRVCHVTKKVLTVCWPWLAALAVPLPVVLLSVDETTRSNYWRDTFCPLHIVFPARIAVLIIVFYLPVGVIAMLAAGVGLVCYFDMTNARPHSRPPRSHNALCRAAATTASPPHAAARGGGRVRGDGFSELTSEETGDRSRDGFKASLLPSPPTSGSHGREDATDITVVADGGDRVDQDIVTATSTTTTTTTTTTTNGDGFVEVVADAAISSSAPRCVVGEDVERPMHMLLPLVVTLVCELPLMICWWFYENMRMDVVILVDVSLHRLYLLRAALLPLSWFILPDLRQALAALRDRLLRGCVACGCLETVGGPRAERGDFTVAYTTLQETGDAHLATQAAGTASDGRRPLDGQRSGVTDVF